jgi:hypothetical protein
MVPLNGLGSFTTAHAVAFQAFQDLVKFGYEHESILTQMPAGVIKSEFVYNL